MEAKDTIMTLVQIATKDPNLSYLEAQAEISFKMGYDKALAQLAGMTEECKLMGRKEVVEFLWDNCYVQNTKETGAWQAFLKEKGIDGK